MLADYTPMPTLGVADMERARAFYEGVLHMTPHTEIADGVLYAAGSGTFMVYPSQYAGTNKATAMSFTVPAEAFDAEVAELRTAGVTFLTFEMEGGSWDDGVASFEGMGLEGVGKAVWFEDPDGNILNIDSMG